MKSFAVLAALLLIAGCAPMQGGRDTGSRSAAVASAPQPSPEIRDAQQRLQSLGLYQGPVDGMWGPETQSAVVRFQRNENLSQTAALDSQTAAALRSAPERRAALARPITISDPTDVRTLQNRLRQLNVYSGPADGVWGPGTQVALEQFQRARGLPVGQFNGQTAVAMGFDANAFPARTASAPASSASMGAGHPLDRGVVRNVQQRLRQQGFYSGTPDGIWGARTQGAVERFQKSRGLEVTGDLNPMTAQALGLDPNNLSLTTR